MLTHRKCSFTSQNRKERKKICVHTVHSDNFLEHFTCSNGSGPAGSQAGKQAFHSLFTVHSVHTQWNNINYPKQLAKWEEVSIVRLVANTLLGKANNFGRGAKTQKEKTNGNRATNVNGEIFECFRNSIK